MTDYDELSINSGPKLPPAYKGNPETFKGTIFAVGRAQSTKYIPGHTGAPIPDVWDDGNPKMQNVIYIVGQSGKAMRIFVGKSNKEVSAWASWVELIKQMGEESFGSLVGKTILVNCKTTYKPGGTEVAFREWGLTEVAGEDYRPNMEEEWKALPTGVLPTFYYPGYSPEEMAAKAATAPAAPPVAAAPAPAAGTQMTAYDEDIPF